MHILVTNDDGIESPGLWILASALRDAGLGTVSIIAPDTEYSGMSMSLPPNAEHLVTSVEPPDPAYTGISAHMLAGTPANCVTIGMMELVGPRPDMVVSGINRGLNTGTNVMLSGTVGAAMIAALWGLPALAVSAHVVPGQKRVGWQAAAWATVRVLPIARELGQPAGDMPLVLNINVPNVEQPEELRGFRQTRLSEFFYGWFIGAKELEPDAQGRRRFSYNYDRNRRQISFSDDSDNGAIQAGYVSVTPLAPMGTATQVSLEEALGGF